jgi:cell division septation protein DedD
LPKNDEGEFELVLGNRQLISVFLIVVVLLGVFFSMGYIVGRNSSPAAGAAEAARADKSSDKSNSDAHAGESASADSANSTEPSEGSNPLSTTADDTTPPTTPPSSTQPERPASAPAGKSTPAPAKESKPKPFPAREASPAAERAPVGGQVAGGQYWQVVATSRPDAEIIAEALAKKGFHAVLAPAPKDGVFRVMVGPLGDSAAQAQTRTNLEAAGFKNPILRKY